LLKALCDHAPLSVRFAGVDLDKIPTRGVVSVSFGLRGRVDSVALRIEVNRAELMSR